MALTDVDEIELESHLLRAMPIVNHFRLLARSCG